MTANGARRGRYQTRQRPAVVRTLVQAPGFLSAQALHARMHLAGETISLTTVYRSLRVLADAGRIDTIHDPAGEQLFHLGTAGRSRHLVCRDCDQNVPIDADTVENWAATTASDHGFTDIQLVIELTGLCPACSVRPKRHTGSYRGLTPRGRLLAISGAPDDAATSGPPFRR